MLYNNNNNNTLYSDNNNNIIILYNNHNNNNIIIIIIICYIIIIIIVILANWGCRIENENDERWALCRVGQVPHPRASRIIIISIVHTEQPLRSSDGAKMQSNLVRPMQ